MAYPASVVLSAAPMPTALPTMPSPRLNRPVPRVMSATTNGSVTPSTAAHVENLYGHNQVGVGHERKQDSAQSQRREADQQRRPASPGIGDAADPRRTSRDDELRYDDAGPDQGRGPLARAHGQ